ncbi:MAG: InlB B-repeat-containing protein, partial [Treponema sp.]|nr:InlB B-repeat-containing protein [Treponema sp.]
MAKKKILWRVLALALTFVFGLGLAGCDNNDDDTPSTTYTVSYDSGDGSGTVPASQTVASGTSINLPGKGNMTAPSGKAFNGWRTGGQNYNVGDSYTVTGNVT